MPTNTFDQNLTPEIGGRIEENFGHRREADVMLPVQYNAIMRERSAEEGERRLMLAVLESAVESYRKHMTSRSHARRRLFLEVRNWINARNRVGLFSYQTLCESLEVDAKALSAALEKRLQQSRRFGSNRSSDFAAE